RLFCPAGVGVKAAVARCSVFAALGLRTMVASPVCNELHQDGAELVAVGVGAALTRDAFECRAELRVARRHDGVGAREHQRPAEADDLQNGSHRTTQRKRPLHQVALYLCGRCRRERSRSLRVSGRFDVGAVLRMGWRLAAALVATLWVAVFESLFRHSYTCFIDATQATSSARARGDGLAVEP